MVDIPGVIPVALARFSLMVPSPVPVVTGMVQVVPDPVTVPMLAPVTPPVTVKIKLEAVTPVTDEPNVAVKFTVVALVGLDDARLIEEIVVLVDILMFLVTVLLLATPSPATNDTPLVVVDEALLEKVMDCSAV